MPSSDTQFSKDKQPTKRRGKSERTKLNEALKRQGKNEDGFYDMLVTRAFDPEDSFAAKEILTRIYPVPKAVLPPMNFAFNENGTLSQQATDIMLASSQGGIPPDVAGIYIGAISNMIKIRELTEFEERIKTLEAAADEQD